MDAPIITPVRNGVLDEIVRITMGLDRIFRRCSPCVGLGMLVRYIHQLKARLRVVATSNSIQVLKAKKRRCGLEWFSTLPGMASLMLTYAM